MAKRIQDFRSFNSSNKNTTSTNNVVEVVQKPKVNIKSEKARKKYTKEDCFFQGKRATWALRSLWKYRL